MYHPKNKTFIGGERHSISSELYDRRWEIAIHDCNACGIEIAYRMHTLLPAIETTDAIGNTENKQVKRNMSKYFQRMFMLFFLSFGYLFYDTYSYFM